MDEFPSGQREQTVNLPSQTSVVRIHPHPPDYRRIALAVFVVFRLKQFVRTLSWLRRRDRKTFDIICAKCDFWLFSRLTKELIAGNMVKRLKTRGSIAQLGEHLPYKQRVTGSSPVVPTINGAVVQLVRMPACHAGGRGFEPLLRRHYCRL